MPVSKDFSNIKDAELRALRAYVDELHQVIDSLTELYSGEIEEFEEEKNEEEDSPRKKK